MAIYTNFGWESRTQDLRPLVKNRFKELCEGCAHFGNKSEDSPCEYCKKETDGRPGSYRAVKPAIAAPTGAALIAAERERQITKEGWTAEHDDQHEDSELAWAACYYAMPCPKAHDGTVIPPFVMFPENWDESWAKRNGFKDRVRDLVKAGALIAAEIDRLQREL